MTTKTRDGRSPLTARQQQLAVRYLPMARSLSRPFKIGWPGHRDDFDSAASLALVESASTFDPSRNVKFSTFARHRIWGALRDVQRSLIALGWRCDPKAAPMISSLPSDPEGKGRVLGADHTSPVGEEIDSLDEVEFMLRKLPARHAQVCRQVYLHGKNQHEAARVIGCSQSRLSYLHREAIEILSDVLSVRPLGGDGAQGL